MKQIILNSDDDIKSIAQEGFLCESDSFDSIVITGNFINLSARNLILVLVDCRRVLKNGGNVVIEQTNNFNLFETILRETGYTNLVRVQNGIAGKKVNHKVSNAKVSVLIPAYRVDFIEKAIDSILNQTYQNLEIIVSDDCPNSAIEEVVYRKYSDKIKYIKGPKKGSIQNIIQLLGYVNGDLIKFVCDDDILFPECIEKMVKVFERYSNVVLVSSNRHFINEIGEFIKSYTEPGGRVWFDSSIFDFSFITSGNHALALTNKITNYFGSITATLIKKSVFFNLISPFEVNLHNFFREKFLVDFTLWAKLLSAGDFCFLNQFLTAYRVHPGSETNNNDIWNSTSHSFFRIMEKLDDLGLLATNKYQREIIKLPEN